MNEETPVTSHPLSVEQEEQYLEVKTKDLVEDFNSDDFAAMMEGGLKDLRLHFERGEKIVGKVCRVDEKNVYVDIKSTQEGIIDKVEFINKEGELTVQVGDIVEAFVVDTRKGITLSVKLGGDLIDSNLDEAFKNGIAVEGKFIAERKGGYTVSIGSGEAFCPYSQADLFVTQGHSLVGVQGLFIITQYSDRDMVVSRKKVLVQEQKKQIEALKWSMKVGDRLAGEVVKVLDFGAFVDIGGIQGMIPASELSYTGKRQNVSDVLSVGDRVEVIVKALNWEAEKITLSYRGAKTSWHDIESEFTQGLLCEGVVTRIESYGAFVEIDDEVEGLLHISSVAETLNRRVKSLHDVMNVGDTIIVEIDAVDIEKHRISLLYSYENLTQEDKQYIKDKKDGVGAGQSYTGTVSFIKPFGVIVDLGAGRSGLLHQSATGGKITHKIGETVDVVVRDVAEGGKRVSLILAGATEEENPLDDWMHHKATIQQEGELNSMASLLGEIKF